MSPAPVQVALQLSSWYTSAAGGVTFTASVQSWSAGPPNSVGSAQFFDGTALLATVPVNAAGVATYSTRSLKAGLHTISASYGAATNYSSRTTTLSITLTQ